MWIIYVYDDLILWCISRPMYCMSLAHSDIYSKFYSIDRRKPPVWTTMPAGRAQMTVIRTGLVRWWEAAWDPQGLWLPGTQTMFNFVLYVAVFFISAVNLICHLWEEILFQVCTGSLYAFSERRKLHAYRYTWCRWLLYLIVLITT